MTVAALPYVFQTQQAVGASVALPDGLFQPGQAVRLVHGGSQKPAWAARAVADGALLVATHLRELDTDQLATHPPAILLLDLWAEQTTLLPDVETLLDTLRPQLPATDVWVDATGLLGHVPFYTDAWRVDRSFCLQDGSWYGTGLPHSPVHVPADWLALAGAQSLPQAWNATQQRAQAFRKLLSETGGKLFGGVSTHAFTCFRPPLVGVPPTALPHLTALIGTGQLDVFRLSHTHPHETLVQELAALWA